MIESRTFLQLPVGRARCIAKNTIDAYRNDLSGFVGFAGEQDGSKAELTPGCIDRELVTGYIAWLGERSYAASTIARKVAALKSFCGFLLDHGDLAAIQPRRSTPRAHRSRCRSR